jgi:hypothetical protein
LFVSTGAVVTVFAILETLIVLFASAILETLVGFVAISPDAVQTNANMAKKTPNNITFFNI